MNQIKFITTFILTFSSLSFSFEVGSSLNFAIAPSYESVALKSDSFSANQPYSAGLQYLIGFRKNYHSADKNSSQSYFEISESMIQHKTDIQLTPQDIEHKQQQILIQYFFSNSLLNDLNVLKIGIGYTGLFDRSTQTTPNVLFVKNDIHAVDLLLDYDVYKKNDITLKIGFDLGLPFRYKEYGVQSGVNLSAYILKYNLNLGYQITDRWSLNGAIRYQQIEMSSDGLGSRGTLNNTESKASIYLPIGVSYDF